MDDINQSPELKPRDNIDALLREVGWIVQAKDEIDLSFRQGLA